MSSFNLPGRLYERLSRHRLSLFAATLLVIALCAALSSRVRMEEDIEAMLPDDRSQVAEDFRLLQKAPFAKKVFIDLEARPGASRETLLATAEQLAGRLKSPYFSRTVCGPADMAGGNITCGLAQMLPSLVSGGDVATMERWLTPEGVRERLRKSYERLFTPEGWASKELIRTDPLGLNVLALGRLRCLNLVPKLRLYGDQFISADGRHTLIVADTPVAMTDSAATERMVQHFGRQVKAVVPESVRASMLSGHLYTLANAVAIKADVSLVLTFSTLGIAALFLIFLRSLPGLFAFLVPFSALAVATVAAAAFYGTLSAMTVGFGGVLLGISVDYAVLVYLGLRSRSGSPAEVLSDISPPVLFGGLTTLAAFTPLLLSVLPGHRQLAFFSMAGIVAALLISLFVLPQALSSAPVERGATASGTRHPRLPSRVVVAVWLVLIGVCAWQATRVEFDGRLRSLSLIPDRLARAEDDFAHTWGGARGKAVAFTRGASPEEALQANARLYDYLAARLKTDEIVSLAPILPPASRQEASRERWAAFWQSEAGKRAVAALLDEGRALGFSEGAFEPFLRLVRHPPAISTEMLSTVGLGELADSMVVRDGRATLAMTLLPDTPAVAALFHPEAGPPPGTRLVSQSRFQEEVSAAIQHDFVRFLVLAVAANLLLLAVLYRDWRKALCALVPVVTGLVVMLGVMGLAGLDFNLFNIAATVLIIGLAVDYGIFMVSKLSGGYDHATERAVLLCGLTTLAGFGSLALAKHPAMHSIGVSVILGICAAVPAALLVIPALYRGEPGE